MPKQKITKEMILDAAFTLLRTKGHEAVNARSIASQAGCSVQPIYSCYSNMPELMEELFVYTQQYLTEYVEKNADKNLLFCVHRTVPYWICQGRKVSVLFPVLIQVYEYQQPGRYIQTVCQAGCHQGYHENTFYQRNCCQAALPAYDAVHTRHCLHDSHQSRPHPKRGDPGSHRFRIPCISQPNKDGGTV